MEFVFELILEIITEPFVEGYAFAMMRFANRNKKVDKQNIKCFVVFECIALFVLFIVGSVMIFETNGSSIWGKAMFISSIAVSFLQIVVGIILRNFSKKK